jgi:L-alanine-DL-glutamate epimerase-like enolase superfamily enzyme
MADTTIRCIEVVPISIPLTRPVKWARGFIDRIEHVIVSVTLSNGVEGIADAAPRPTVYGETPESIVTLVEKHLAPLLAGLDAFDVQRASALMSSLIGNPAAKAAVDLALNDALAKTLGISCAQLLGGSPKPVPLNWRIRAATKDEALAEAEQMIGKYGFRALKVKCGMDVDADLDVLRALRRHVGDHVEIAVDMNQAYSAAQLLAAARALEEVGVALIEEPLAARDGKGKLIAARGTHIPFTGDDSCVLLDDVRAELELGAIRSVVIKCVRTGYTISRDVLALCRAFHIPAHNGSNADMRITSAASGHFACTYETPHAHEMSYFLDAADTVADQPLEVKDGCLVLPDRPGIGLGLDRNKLQRYRV